MEIIDKNVKKLKKDRRFKTDDPRDTSKKYNSFYPKCAEALARLGLKNYQIYILLDISEVSGVRWYKTIPEFKKAIQDGRDNKVDFNFAPVCGEIELRESMSKLILENETLKQQNEIMRNDLDIKYKPINLEHEKQMKLLKSIEERNIPKVKPVERPKQSNNSVINNLNKFQIDPQYIDIISKLKLTFIDTNLSKQEINKIMNAESWTIESKQKRRERWNRGEYYNITDYFNSETPNDRQARYARGIYTQGELADSTFDTM
jgi:hypothetical protein